MMQTQIPMGLQALMQASQVLQQESTPVVQTPMGPKPTVAGMVNQGLTQLAGQKAAPFMQAPGVRQAGKQAGVAGQLMAQQQARQQQMAQNPQAIAEMAAKMIPQQQQAPGIEGIPVEMEFKEGGIIGFAGPTGSEVPKPGESIEQIVGESQSKKKSEIDALSSELADVRQRFVAASQSGDPNAVRMYLQPMQQLQQRITQLQEGMFPSAPSAEVAQVPQAPAAPQAAPAAATRVQGQFSSAPTGIATRLIGGGPEQPRYRTMPEPVAPRPAAPRPTGPAVSSTGIAVPSEIAKPSMDVAAAAAERFAPAKPMQDIVDAMRKRAEQKEKDIAAMPDLDQAGIAAIERASAERERLRKAKQERDQINRTLAFFKDLGRRGSTSYESVQEAIEAREEASRTAALNEEQAIIKHRAAQQARALGKYDRADALDKEVLGHLEKLRTSQIQAAKIGADIDTTRYQSDVQFASQRLTDASRERDTARQIAARQAELEKTKDGQLLNSAQSRVTELIKAEADFKTKNKTILGMENDPNAMKQPMVRDQVKELRQQLNAIESDMKIAIQTRDQLFARVFGQPVSSASSASGQRKPDLKFDAQGNLIK